MFLRSLSFLGAAAALTCGWAEAGVVTGRLMDNHGQPVRNAVFEFKSSDGTGTPIVSGGFSDANGMFTTTVTPDGDYRMTVFPLPPPQSLVVTRHFDGIAISGATLDLGTQVLEVGTLMSGRVVNTGGTPLQAVSLDFVAGSDQQPLDFTNPDTNAFGLFSVAVPFGECEVRFKPGPVPYYGGPSTAPWSNTWIFTGPTHVGDIVMPQGTLLSGRVVRASDGSAVEDAQVRVVDPASGRVVYTPENRSDALGNFLLNLPAGYYGMSVLPRSNEGLTSKVLPNRAVPPGGTLGTVTLQDGFELSGRVRDWNHVACAGTMVNLSYSATGEPLAVAGNVTDALGNYSLFVPAGTFDVEFTAPFSMPLGGQLVEDLLIFDDTDLDAELPEVEYHTLAGIGTAGSGGLVPQISSSGGTPRLGNNGYGGHLHAGPGWGHRVPVLHHGAVADALLRHYPRPPRRPGARAPTRRHARRGRRGQWHGPALHRRVQRWWAR
ncbi:MAG: hypothetical protein IPK67_04525 [Planctomycetes bacterium]|nr:hypothetical protein [Planctomycetota bacterium]